MNLPTTIFLSKRGKVVALGLIALLAPLAFIPIGVEAGSQSYSSSGTYSFTVPSYATLTVTVNGAGGGGGGTAKFDSEGWLIGFGQNGYSGGASSFNGTVIGNGGGPGLGNGESSTASGGLTTFSNSIADRSAGTAGTASGGDTNTTGGGASGGARGYVYSGGPYYNGSNGGAGGRAVKTYAAGALTAGATISVVVGTAGAGGTLWESTFWADEGTQYNHTGGHQGAAGSNGSVSIEWTDPVAPTVTSDSTTSYAPTTATLYGTITATGGQTGSGTQHGFAYSTHSSLATGVSTTTEGTYAGTGAFSGTLTGLSTSTTYYYRAYATNSAGSGYGSIQSFTTPSTVSLSVTTASTSAMTGSGARLNGVINATGGPNAVVWGFAWGTNAALSGGDTATTSATGDFGAGAFGANITGLTAGTTYYFRAFATSTGRSGYGVIKSFKYVQTTARKIRLWGGVRILGGVRLW